MLKVYHSKNVGQAQLQLPQMRPMGGASVAQVANLMPTDVIETGRQAVGAINEALTEYQRVQDNADIADALSDLQLTSIQYQADYKKSRGGIMARDAGKDWLKNVMSAGQEISKRFEGRQDLQQKFGQAVQKLGLQSYENGMMYSHTENDVYLSDMRKKAVASFKTTIATGSPQQVHQEKERLLSTITLTSKPGRDLTLEIMAADRMEAEGLIERNIVEGDFSEALAIWKDFKPQLGEKAPAWLKQIKEAKISSMKLAISLDEYEHKKAERVRKAAASEAEKTLTDMFTGVGLSVTDVQSFRDVLSPEDYRAWSERALNGPKVTSQDDRNVFVDLTERQNRGEDIGQAAKSAYLDGKITQSTYKDFTSAVMSDEDKSLLSYLDNALKPSEMNTNPAHGANYANARADAMMFLRRNKMKPFKEKDAFVRSVARRYSLIDPNNSTLALPMPRYFEGSRSNINKQTLEEAALRTQEAYESKRISLAEYEEECERIENLLSVWERMQAGRTQMEE